MKAFLCMLIAALAAWTSVTAFSADTGREERLLEARAVMAAAQVDRQLDALTAAMSTAFAREFAHTAQARDSRMMDIIMSESMESMKEQMTQPGGLFDMIVETYAAQFSLDELRQIRAFYESPVGQRVLQELPQMMQRMMPQAIKAGRESAPQLCGRIKARLAAEGFKEAQGMPCPATP
jgi:hypothetical protein